MNAARLTYRSGFLGVIIASASVLATGISYTGEYGQSYSILNHYISELGEVGVSEMATVFNIGLIAGGLCVVAYMVGLGLYSRRWPMYLVAVTGVVSGIALSFVGIFPVNNLDNHVIAAATFFFGGLITTVLFAVAVMIDRENVWPKWLVLPTLVSTLSFALFLFLPALLYGGMVETEGVAIRPDFSLTPFLEWLVLFTFMAWVLSVSYYLWRQEGQER